MKTLSLLLLLLVIITSSVFAADLTPHESIREIQTVLLLKGHYDGHIDGLNGPKTERAILRYEQQLGWPLTGKNSERLTERLRMETESAPHGVGRGNDDHNNPKVEAESDIDKKIGLLTRDLNHTESHLAKLRSSLEATQKTIDHHFIHNFSDLTIIGVTSLGIIAAVIGVVCTLGFPTFASWITEKVKSSHTDMVELSADRIAARIYGALGGSSIELYQHITVDPEKKHTKALYDRYLGLAVELSSRGYKHAKSLIERVVQSKEPLSPLDKQVYENCVNNKLFYLATRATEEDKREAEVILRDAERIAADYEASKEPPWWAFRETVAWAQLNFAYETEPNIKNEVQAMMDNPRLPIEWKIDVKKRYDKWASEKGKELRLETPKA
ncbi:MAG: peptidoglycan-binding protein [Nitrososphaera sp.]|nr:peptidoglycan-binding protein [Nitrososphaera sp.]